MKKLILLIFLLPFLVFSQTKELDTPELPDWVIDTLYIDISNTGSANLGTYDNPINNFESHFPSWPWNSTNVGWDASNSYIRNLRNTALLFKAGVSHNPITDNLDFGIIGSPDLNANNIYIGSYGPGSKPFIKLRQLRLSVDTLSILGLHLEGRDQDTTYLQELIRLGASYDATQTVARTPQLLMKDVDITRAYRAISISRWGKAVLENVSMSNIYHDGIYATAMDSLFIDNWHITTFNKEWEWTSHHDGIDQVPGGDALQLTHAGADDPDNAVRFTRIDNSYIDGSHYGGKFVFIGAGPTGRVEIHNSLIKTHKYKRTFHATGGPWYVYNSVFLNHGSLGQYSRLRAYNTIFIGTEEGRDNPEIEGAVYRQGYLSQNALNTCHYCLFVNFYNINVQSFATDFRNSTFINIVNPTFGNTVNGSGNIHWNTDESTPNISYYSVSSYDNRNNVEPLFINGSVSYTINTTDNRQYQDNERTDVHHYVEWDDWGDWRYALSTSPGVDEADDTYTLDADIDGIARPQGAGYDIGPYEWYDGQPTEPTITYTLSTSTTGSGTIAKSPDKVNYDVDESVTLTANPASGWEFTSWSGDLSGSTNPETLIMNSAKNVTATFTELSPAPDIDDLIDTWVDYNYYPLFGTITTTQLINTYNTYWTNLTENYLVLKNITEVLADTVLVWNNDAITPLDFSMRGIHIRNTINDNNYIIFSNMETLYPVIVGLPFITSITGYQDFERSVLTSGSQQAFITNFNWNINILGTNVNTMFNEIVNNYGN